jgi:hypothetical protein
MIVDRRVSNPYRLGDVADAGAGVAAAGEELEGAVEDLAAGGRALPWPSPLVL